jgi:hypothetical protein
MPIPTTGSRNPIRTLCFAVRSASEGMLPLGWPARHHRRTVLAFAEGAFSPCVPPVPASDRSKHVAVRCWINRAPSTSALPKGQQFGGENDTATSDTVNQKRCRRRYLAVRVVRPRSPATGALECCGASCRNREHRRPLAPVPRRDIDPARGRRRRYSGRHARSQQSPPRRSW